MRFIIFFILIILANAIGAQPPKSSSKTPSRSQMQSQMNEVVNELNKQIAETEKQLAEAKKNKEDDSVIKSLEDELAMLKKQVNMMGGLNKNVSMMSEKIIEQATEEKKSGTVPKRDLARIRQIPEKTLTDAELVSFVKKVHAEVEKLLNAEDKAEAQKIYATLKSEKKSSNDINNMANSLWLAGYPELALYVLGKECTANINDANILNNYAAFLTMKGGEHAAIPILQNLNQKFPGNSTILNNIGQAWFGLGEINNAKKSFDNTMRAYGLHSQANQTMCMIQESEGKTGEAIESIKKSIKENYTTEKEARLNELGGKLEYNDLPFRYPAKAEPLGIEKFMNMIPPYPFEAGATSQRSQIEWDDFRIKVWDAMEKVKQEARIKEQNLKAYQELLLKNPSLLKPYNTTVYKTSVRKLSLLYEWYSERIVALSKKSDAAKDSINKWKDDLYKAIEALGYDPQNPNANCGKIQSLSTAFLLKANTLLQQRNTELLSLEKQKLNAEATYALYGTHDRSIYEVLIVKIKESLLILLGNMQCEFQIGCTDAKVQKPPGKVLPDFDSLNCKYKEEFNIPPFTQITIECNRMTTEFNIDTELGIKLKAKWEENLNSGKLTKGTLEVGKEWGPSEELGPTKFGPKPGVIGAELKGELGMGVEINSDGVQELYIKGSSTIDLAGNIGDAEITPGVQSDPKGLSVTSAEVKISWNVGSGPNKGTMNSSLTGQGMLNPINISLR